MSSIASVVKSPRFSRLLFWAGALVLAAGVTFFIVKLAGRNDSGEPAANVNLNSPAALNEPTAPTKRKPAHIDPAAREVAGKFILTAVARKHLADSWNYVSPGMRAGYTLKQWKTGNLPIVPYPVSGLDQARFKVNYQQPRELDMDVALIPKKNAGVDATTFQMVLVKRGSGAKAHWYVDYWMPKSTIPVPNAPGSGGSN